MGISIEDFRKNRISSITDEGTKPEGNNGNSGTDGNSGSADSPTTKEKRGKSRTKGNSGTDGEPTEEKGKESLEVVVLEPPNPKKDEVKEEVKEEEKPQKKRRTKKNKIETNEKAVKQLALLLVGVSSMLATRPNMSHWMMSEDEATTIAKPLFSMIQECEKLKGLSEHTNAIALVVACGTVLLPRIVISAMYLKQEKPKKKGVIKNERKISDDNRRNDEQVAPSYPNDDKPFLDLMPSLSY